MELHDQLYALGLQSGRDVFDDPERLRGLLASTGAPVAEVDLVVDAVRRGAFRGLLAALDAGTDPTRAVVEAGQRLGGERGSDPGAASWALAVLGFAVGRLGENDVRRHRGAPPAGAPLPPSGPPQRPPTPTPVLPQAQVPTQVPHYPTPTTPTDRRAATRSRTPLVVGVLATVVAVALAVVLAIVVADRNGTPSAGADDPSPSAQTSDPSSDPTSTDPTTAITSETTSEPPEDPNRVSDEASRGYTRALFILNSDFTKSGNRYSAAIATDNLRKVKAALRSVRADVYAFDLSVRELDLAPVQGAVNRFLRTSGRLISGLDRIDRTATTTFDANIGFLGLPLTAYDGAYQDLQDAIDKNRSQR